MQVAITGSTGLIGRALTARLRRAGHEVRPFRRGPEGDPEATWDPGSGWIRPGTLSGLDAVVHLAGESIGDGRWSDARKQVLWRSRIESTRLLVNHVANEPNPPALIGASAVGFYGDRGDDLLDETSSRGTGFLADLAAAWETEALRAREAGVRTVVCRFGVVLDRDGGALPRMVKPFRFGAGGRLGHGRQWLSWVALEDAVAALEFAVTNDLSGVYNVVSPQPVTNREFTRALARALRRPALFPVPGLALRAVLGESAGELLLASQRVEPRRLVDSGFNFEHPEVHTALKVILKGGGNESSSAHRAAAAPGAR